MAGHTCNIKWRVTSKIKKRQQSAKHNIQELDCPGTRDDEHQDMYMYHCTEGWPKARRRTTEQEQSPHCESSKNTEKDDRARTATAGREYKWASERIAARGRRAQCIGALCVSGHDEDRWGDYCSHQIYPNLIRLSLIQKTSFYYSFSFHRSCLLIKYNNF